ncbi:MAG: hypothetical protein AB7E31_06005 [Desulfitobacterium sp.]
MTLEALHESDQPKEDQLNKNHLNDDQKVNHPFQVVCSVCHKTISYSGEDGQVYLVKCDECAGV